MLFSHCDQLLVLSQLHIVDFFERIVRNSVFYFFYFSFFYSLNYNSD